MSTLKIAEPSEALNLSKNSVSYEKMPGHWVLASMGKRVLRPGGLELTQWMLDSLKISPTDDVVELAPGVGRTAQITLKSDPHTYIGIERDPTAAAQAGLLVKGKGRKILVRKAESTELFDETASVLYGEAFLTMQTQRMKVEILHEATRLLKKEGRYGLHELCINSNDAELIATIQRELSEVIRVNAKPLSRDQWQSLIKDSGLSIVAVRFAPMALLEFRRMIQDEGLTGTLKIVSNLLRHPSALKRAIRMRKVFRKFSETLGAISIIAKKPEESGGSH